MKSTILSLFVIVLVFMATFCACAAMAKQNSCSDETRASILSQIESSAVGKILGKTITNNELENFDCVTNVRVWHPDSMGTMDYRASRLNVYVNDDNVVERVTFG